ncbi:MAG TPA: putative metal-binding motif-containing protein [Sandaracinaceae bacterium LLY-WYZ-13_1]|nr:putative metal-binding motif-containing protein [Sandaracinaceae bacterium LLY-WYZ-13_1]
MFRAHLTLLVPTLLLTGCMGALSSSPGEGGVCGSDSDCPVGFECLGGGCHRSIPEGDTCLDADGDGYSDGNCPPEVGELDCDDADPETYPGAEEQCADGIDQDCDVSEDEGCDCSEFGVGTTQSCGMGACVGLRTCTESGWSTCSGADERQPRDDCGPSGSGNDRDEDCDGDVDDGCISCGDRPDGLGAEDVCFDETGAPDYCSSNGDC